VDFLGDLLAKVTTPGALDQDRVARAQAEHAAGRTKPFQRSTPRTGE
jgi:hypothetical protein